MGVVVGLGLFFVFPHQEDGLYVGRADSRMLELDEELDRFMERYPEKERKLELMEIDATG